MRSKRLTALICLWTIVLTLAGPGPFWGLAPLTPNLAAARPLVTSLIINEYLADPPDGLAGDSNGDGQRDSADDEFIELINTGTVPLDVGGLTVSDAASVRFTFPAGKIIPAGDGAVVFGGGTPTGAFGNATANGLVFTAGSAGLSLNNGGDTIVVKEGADIVASLIFGSSEGNANQSITRSPDITGAFVTHSSASGSGGALFSPGTTVSGLPFATPLPIITSIDPSTIEAGSGPVSLTVNGNNFQSGAIVLFDSTPVAASFFSASLLTVTVPSVVANTPGSYDITVRNPDDNVSNSMIFTVTAPIILSDIGINEFLADPPDGPAGDANGDGTRDSAQDEFVEIVNRTEAAIDVSGFTLSDASQVRFTFPPGSTIPGTEVAVVFGGGHPTGDFGNAAAGGLVFTAALSLNNGGDTITIKDGSGNVVESVVFGGAEGGANQSINRNPDIVGTTFATHSSIPSSGGRLFSPGTRVDGMAFTIAPRITSLSPASAPLGSPPVPMTVLGSGFEPGSIVLVDSTPTDTTRISDDTLMSTVPASVLAVAGPHIIRVLTQGGVSSNGVVFTVIPPPPLLRAIRPRVVIAGSTAITVLLEGANFVPGAVLRLDGTSVSTTFLNSRELQATVPANRLVSPGLRRVQVRNGDSQLSNELTLEVIPAGPSIAGLQPAQSLAGGPDLRLQVNGARFTERSAVVFDGKHVQTTFVSATQLQADVPARFISDPGLRAVKVATDGAESNEAIFRVVAIAPVILSLEPASVAEGSGKTTVVVIGSEFQSGALVRVVEREQPGITLETRFLGPERLEAVLPAALTETAGSMGLRVENPDFGISGELRFDVLIRDLLVINEYLADPPDGPAGDANRDGSRSASQDEFVEIVNRSSAPIDLTGWKLSDGASVRHVFASGTIVPPSETVVVFGGGTPTGAFGNAGENQLVFRASSGGLSLDNGGDVIKLEDAAGRAVQEIRFGSEEGGANQSINREPDVDGPAFVPHSRVAPDLSLFSPGARASGDSFTVKPAIEQVAPSTVHSGSPSFSLRVAGARFIEGATVVFDGHLLVTLFRSSTELEATVTSDLVVEGGVVEVRVRNTKGELSTASRFVIADDPPRIASITPRKTSTGAEGLELTLTGERFQKGARVTINGEPVETTYEKGEGPATLRAFPPDHYFAQAGTLEAGVVNADGNRSNTIELRVDNGPLITRLSRSRVKAGRGDLELSIGGVAFNEGLQLFADDIPVQTRFVSDVLVEVTLPAEVTGSARTLSLQLRSADGGRSNRVTFRVVP